MKKIPIDKNKIKKILVIRPDHIGDLMLTAPALKAIKKGFPAAQISLLVGKWNKELLDKSSLVDETIIYNSFWCNRGKDNSSKFLPLLKQLRNSKFDMVISFRGELQERILAYLTGAPVRVGFYFGLGKIFLNRLVLSSMDKHIIDRYLDVALDLGCRVVDKELLKIDISDEDRAFALGILNLEKFPKNLLFTIAPGAGYASKLWDTKKFANVINCLIEKYYDAKVVIVGTSSELSLAEEILALTGNKDAVVNLAGKTNIKQLAALINLSALTICLDSAPMHIAASLGVPLVALFGPTIVKQWGPYPASEKTTVITKNLACCGCVKPRSCANECMQSISEQEVLEAAYNLIEKFQINTLISKPNSYV